MEVEGTFPRLTVGALLGQLLRRQVGDSALGRRDPPPLPGRLVVALSGERVGPAALALVISAAGSSFGGRGRFFVFDAARGLGLLDGRRGQRIRVDWMRRAGR